MILALLAAVAFTNLYLTRHLFRHIQLPLDAQSRQQQKQELIAGMSHDLKSPLTSIRAYTEGLLDGVAKDAQTRTRYLQTIYAKETELEALVNRLFSFAKLDLSQTQAEPVPLAIAETLREIVDGFDAEALDIRLPELPKGRMLADRELLAHGISNLLDNSRKYGAGHAIVSAKLSGDTVRICVSDDGPGVEAAQLEKIFEPGYRTDSARQNPAGGSGIGLAVVKKAAEQMHGSVKAENQTGGGLCVTLTLLRENTAGVAIRFVGAPVWMLGYLFLSGAVAITAMVLPGISGSTILLIAGVYLPAIQAIKAFLGLDFSVLPGLCALGLGIPAGIALSIHAIRAALKKYRSQMVWLILGLMAGSLYAIVMGPAGLDVPQPPVSLRTFDLIGFTLGAALLLGLELLRKRTVQRAGAFGPGTHSRADSAKNRERQTG